MLVGWLGFFPLTMKLHVQMPVSPQFIFVNAKSLEQMII